MVSAAASTVIHAPAERVWEVLADLEAYPHWNPIFSQVRGALRSGERLDLSLTGDGREGAHWTVSAFVLEVRRNRSFRWLLTRTTGAGDDASDSPSAAIYAVDLKPAQAGGTIVRERLTVVGSSDTWLGDSDMMAGWLKASTGALWDRVDGLPAEASAHHPIAGTIRLVSRHGCRDHVTHLPGLRRAVSDLVAAWPRSAAA
jgi:uncharacterized protein YndB with AHSA1/START domain